MKTSKLKNITLLLLALVFFQACSNDDDNPTTPELADIPELITISSEGLYPGKFDFNAKNNQFVVGSLTKSEVGLVDPQTGDYTTFITDTDLALVTGIYADNANNRLLVASGDFGFSLNSVGLGKVAYLGIYNLTTGAKITGVDLATLHPENSFVFANDIAIDNSGNIYITDSYNPVIYKINQANEPSIFLDGGAAFENVPGGGGLALNGIVYVDGNLIVGKTDSGELFKVPVADPTSFINVNIPDYRGSDGLELRSDGSIVMVETGIGPTAGARILESTDGWDSAQSVSTFSIASEEFPTSATIAYDNEVYILTSHLSKLTSGNTTHENYNIYRLQ
jgi:hypothetical protein